MLITKIFHLRQSVPEAKERLRDLGTWNEPATETGVLCSATEEDGLGRFDFVTPNGARLSAMIEEIPGDEPHQILFRSVGGDVELAGLVEFYEIRPSLTEVVLTLDYEPCSRLQKAFETVAAAVDRFLNRQLARIEKARDTETAAAWVERFA